MMEGRVFDCGVRSGKRRKMLATPFSFFDPVANFQWKKGYKFHLAFFSLKLQKLNYLNYFFYVLFRKYTSVHTQIFLLKSLLKWREKFDLYFASTLPSA